MLIFSHIGACALAFSRIARRACMAWLTSVIDMLQFAYRTGKVAFHKGVQRGLFVDQFFKIAIGSCPIVVLTGFSAGLAVGLQAYVSFNRFGVHDFMGTIVALGMLRELGPVLTGLMLVSRCGSAIAAELATMRVGEQIDALKTMLIDPFSYLIVPRAAACLLALPLLSIMASACGMMGGYILCVQGLGVNSHAYHSGIQHYVSLADIAIGMIKALVFGGVIGWASTYFGYRAQNNSFGVGRATTACVSMGSVGILVANYVVSNILFQVGLG